MSSKKKTPFRQLTLNFGQKPAEPNQCKECGMIYDLDDRHDDQMHTKYHQDKDRAVKYFSMKGEKVVQEYLDGKCVVIQIGIDQKLAIQKAFQILEFVDSQLGINERIFVSQNNSENSQNMPCHVKNLSKFYFFISFISKKIDGFCLAEPIEWAHRIKYLGDNQTNFTFDELKKEKAYCGITRIWVSAEMRRKGIASRLLECVCQNFLYIKPLMPSEIAFSDPTQLGQSLARSFTKSNHFLIYNNPKRKN
ncbi:N-acetyltransferase ESCO2 isoform X1 [Brachionus plicatilis]|uniref:N-acetyltransferase ESCO2 isoform X1 n=1 Tax=Brachionus plicatilis TaxID=10195 RepID=A0A3M7QL74_BRAPC|nr:N-acetyltransferase ESCO2 isoform X1 [Brachionus plicatilis]